MRTKKKFRTVLLQWKSTTYKKMKLSLIQYLEENVLSHIQKRACKKKYID
jgi:hypothetical protein